MNQDIQKLLTDIDGMVNGFLNTPVTNDQKQTVQSQRQEVDQKVQYHLERIKSANSDLKSELQSRKSTIESMINRYMRS